MTQEQVAAAVIIALICQKKKSRKKRQKRKICVEPWLERRKNLGFYESLLAELRLENEYNYKDYLRVTFENFEEIFQPMKGDINKY